MSKISILLSTYNGEKYLKAQLDSLYSQSYQDFKLIVRDDGSKDRTKEILNSYDIKLVDSSKNLGVKKSFETLLKYASENSDAEYFIFCDQDDVWNNDKIEKTLKKMQELETFYGNKIPLLDNNYVAIDKPIKYLVEREFLAKINGITIESNVLIDNERDKNDVDDFDFTPKTLKELSINPSRNQSIINIIFANTNNFDSWRL